MDATSPEQQGQELYRPDELIVAIPHVNLVSSELRQLGEPPSEPDKDERLGLARLTLSNLRGVADKLEQEGSDRVKREIDARRKQRQSRPSLTGDEGSSPLDDLLVGLRERFAEKNVEWVPTIGKNRIIEPLTGAPYLSGGGEGPPKQATALDPRDAIWPGRGVRIGVLDTPLCEHPWLAGSYVAAPDALLPLDPPAPEGKIPSARAGHATFVAGLILQQAPGAQLEVSPVLDNRGEGTLWKAAQQIMGFAGSGVDILNLSFVCFTNDGEAPLVMATAIDRLGPEIVVVAAAGNYGDPRLVPDKWRARTRMPCWPAALDDVVAVGAVGLDGERAAFSPDAVWVDGHERGVDVKSTYVTGTVLGERLLETPAKDGKRTEKVEVVFKEPYGTWDGTSFAAATFSGKVAAGVVPGRRDAREVVRQLLGSH